jgi:hypothetical protein
VSAQVRAGAAEARAVPCPRCLALTGVACRAANGARTSRSHGDRVRLWERTASPDAAVRGEAEAQWRALEASIEDMRGITWRRRSAPGN